MDLSGRAVDLQPVAVAEELGRIAERQHRGKPELAGERRCVLEERTFLHDESGDAQEEGSLVWVQDANDEDGAGRHPRALSTTKDAGRTGCASGCAADAHPGVLRCVPNHRLRQFSWKITLNLVASTPCRSR